MKMKLLSPAGDMESLKMAIFNGADEVYLGVKDYNARNNIAGFSLDDLPNIVEFAHIYNVKVLLTVNILFTDEELQSALDLIVDAYNIGVDAFIMQDIGLISLVREHFPMIEIHASTQMGIHNLEGVREAEKLGIKRVVLSRETPLEEIKRIRENSNIELEYFVQGALCVSFSGNCYLSSYLFDASGNRGKCKQLCRLPYTLSYNDKKIKSGYLLSAKDFNMINRLGDLRDAGINVLKIEGRARRPYYVGVATRTYRNALDEKKFDEEELRIAFNRTYTDGYFNGNGNIISNKQNHIGIEIGKVTDAKQNKKFNTIFITSNRELSPKSTLKFFDGDKEVAVLSAFDLTKIDYTYKITTTQKIKIGWTVNLIADADKESEMLNTKLKRPIEIEITAKENKNLTAKFKIDDNEFVVIGEVCDTAKSYPLSAENFVENFSKSEYFDAKLKLDIGNIFVAKSKLNEFRRQVFAEIKNKTLNKNIQKYEKIKLKTIKNNVFSLNYYEFIENFENLDFENLKNENIKTLIFSPSNYNQNDIEKFFEICKENSVSPILNTPIFMTHEDIELLRSIVEDIHIPILANNLCALSLDTEIYIGGGLNVYNDYTKNYFGKPYLTAEGDGHILMPYMTLRHCPMKEHLGADCAHCPYKDGYTYAMENRKTFKLKRTRLATCTFYLSE